MEKEYIFLPDDPETSYDPDWDISGQTNPDDFEGDFWEDDISDPEEDEESEEFWAEMMGTEFDYSDFYKKYEKELTQYGADDREVF